MSYAAGPSRLSLEAVAAEAGISKGGLLYHFRSKPDLLRALVEDHVDQLRARMDHYAPGARAGGEGLRAMRAYLAANRELFAEFCPAPSGVMAAIAEDPEMIAPIRAFRAEMRALIDACPDPAIAAVVFHACGGLIHEKLTGQGCEEPEAAEVFDALAGLIGQD